MDERLLYQIFECVIVIFETFIIYQYLNGLFVKRHEDQNAFPWYIIYGLGLGACTLYFISGIVLTLYILIGCFLLTTKLYKTSLSTRIIVTFVFALIMMLSEIVTTALLAFVFKMPIPNMLVYGIPRVFIALASKLMQMFLIKGIVTLSSHRNAYSKNVDSFRMMLPLLFCQIVLILLAYYVSVICRYITGYFSPVALLAMIGIIYISIIIFWYFDRLKNAFEYKSRTEAAEYKLALEKQYHQRLNEHQQETDALWHDMKKHIRLMKALVAENALSESDQYIKDLEIEMDNSLKIIRSGYPVLSALLTEQKRRAKQANVSYDIDVRLEGALKIQDVDLCIILDNLFDNALEACMLLPAKSELMMKVDIMQKNHALSICFMNTYDSSTRKKWHPGKHGLGLRNVRQAVHKYGGTCHIKEERDIFNVTILIP